MEWKGKGKWRFMAGENKDIFIGILEKLRELDMCNGGPEQVKKKKKGEKFRVRKLKIGDKENVPKELC